MDALGGSGGMDNERCFRGLRSAVGNGGSLVFFQQLMHEQDARHILDLLISHTDCHFFHRTVGQTLVTVMENNNIAQTQFFFFGQQHFQNFRSCKRAADDHISNLLSNNQLFKSLKEEYLHARNRGYRSARHIECID